MLLDLFLNRQFKETVVFHFGTDMINNFAMKGDAVMVYTTPSALFMIGGITLGVLLLIAGLITGKRGYEED